MAETKRSKNGETMKKQYSIKLVGAIQAQQERYIEQSNVA
jgi:hypothetical protein